MFKKQPGCERIKLTLEEAFKVPETSDSNDAITHVQTIRI